MADPKTVQRRKDQVRELLWFVLFCLASVAGILITSFFTIQAEKIVSPWPRFLAVMLIMIIGCILTAQAGFFCLVKSAHISGKILSEDLLDRAREKRAAKEKGS